MRGTAEIELRRPPGHLSRDVRATFSKETFSYALANETDLARKLWGDDLTRILPPIARKSEREDLSSDEARYLATVESTALLALFPELCMIPRVFPLYRLRRVGELMGKINPLVDSADPKKEKMIFLASGDTIPEVIAFTIRPPEINTGKLPLMTAQSFVNKQMSLVAGFRRGEQIRGFEKIAERIVPIKTIAVEPNKNHIAMAKLWQMAFGLADYPIDYRQETLGQAIEENKLPRSSRVFWISAVHGFVSDVFLKMGDELEDITKYLGVDGVGWGKFFKDEEMSYLGREGLKATRTLVDFLKRITVDQGGSLVITNCEGSSREHFYATLIFMNTIAAALIETGDWNVSFEPYLIDGNYGGKTAESFSLTRGLRLFRENGYGMSGWLTARRKLREHAVVYYPRGSLFPRFAAFGSEEEALEFVKGVSRKRVEIAQIDVSLDEARQFCEEKVKNLSLLGL